MQGVQQDAKNEERSDINGVQHGKMKIGRPTEEQEINDDDEGG
jgi:hypothetical protein